MPVAYTPIYVPANNNNVIVVPAGGILRLMGYTCSKSGWSWRGARAKIHHGSITGDLLIATINMIDNGHKSQMFGELGIPCPQGIFLERALGNSEWVFYVTKG